MHLFVHFISKAYTKRQYVHKWQSE